MGWQDREYANDAYDGGYAARWGVRRPPPATFVLLVLRALAFALALMLHASEGGSDVVAHMQLSGPRPHPLGILLHPLAAVRPFTLVFELLAIWALGRLLEPLLGMARLVFAWILANLAAGGVYFVLASVFAPLGTEPLDYGAGALAAWCLAVWQRFRRVPTMVFRWRTSLGALYAMIAGVVMGLAFVRAGGGAIAWLVAVCAGGASMLVVERLPRTGLASWTWPTRRSAASRTPDAADDAEIDRILAKISRDGIDALTSRERRRLDAARRAKQKDARR